MKVIRTWLTVLVMISTCFLEAKATAIDFVSSHAEVMDRNINRSTQDTSQCLPFPKPMDCEEVRLNGNNVSGVYTIWPRSRSMVCKSIQVYCDMKPTGEGWTVLQRRGKYGSPENYFHKSWEFYKNGFGELKKDFWLGNDIIFALTNQGPYSVRFELGLSSGKSAYANYDQFWIEDEERKYKLSIAEYSGTAGDSMTYHHKMMFSTRDKDNDASASDHCAATRTGGWWFNACLHANLNGLHKIGKYTTVQYNFGVVWSTLGGYRDSLAYSEIKIRPRHFK